LNISGGTNQRKKISLAKKEAAKSNEENGLAGLELSIDSFFRSMITGEIYLIGEIDDEKVNDVIQRIQFLDRIGQHIVLYISSPGGLALSAVAIYDILKTVNVKVFTIASGYCQSAALIVFLGGDVRCATPHTRFMIHSGQWGTEDNECGKLDEHVGELRQVNKMMESILKKELKARHFDLSEDKRYFFGVSEAIQYGIVHERFLPSGYSRRKFKYTNNRKKKS
jgi:ATP-dependent Clp endopeptidase proteolytic subunit ClpP